MMLGVRLGKTITTQVGGKKLLHSILVYVECFLSNIAR